MATNGWLTQDLMCACAMCMLWVRLFNLIEISRFFSLVSDSHQSYSTRMWWWRNRVKYPPEHCHVNREWENNLYSSAFVKNCVCLECEKRYFQNILLTVSADDGVRLVKLELLAASTYSFEISFFLLFIHQFIDEGRRRRSRRRSFCSKFSIEDEFIFQ